MLSSNKFITVDNNELNFHSIPNISEEIPVISCIGTSRDGKSTLLNLYTKWLQNNNNLNILGHNIINPFLAQQSDDAVTNGIDYLYIKERCLLFDCQGMQLNSAKFDHYLALIIYLISNVIILTVRQRLDLQVLNNLLSIFSFLSDISEEYRRKDKPKLIIRIKDFQNIKMLKENKNYLDNLVSKWLEKSDDQYDKIKEAFKITFDIYPIITLTPKFDGDELDIYDEDFIINNPTFTDICIKIDELSKDFVTSDLIKDKFKMINLVKSLKNNKDIDFRKLDLYYNITNVELLKYLNNNIKLDVYTNRQILEEMNGSIIGYNKILDRKMKIEDLYNYTYNIKFKDVPNDIKDEVFNDIFNEFNNFIVECFEKSYNNANLLIKNDKDKFYDIIVYNLEDYEKKYDILKKRLENMDNKLAKDILLEIEKDKNKFTEVLNIIEDKNRKQYILIENLIKLYNITKNYTLKLNDIIDKITFNSNFENYNDVNKIVKNIYNKILDDIDVILEENNEFSRINKDYEIDTIKINLNPQNYMIELNNFCEIVKDNIFLSFNKIGLLNQTFIVTSFSYINIYEIRFSNLDPYYMTNIFYEEHFKNILDKFKYNNLKKIINEYDYHTIIIYKFDDIFSTEIEYNRKQHYIKVIEDKFILNVFEYMIENNLKIS